MGHLGCAAGGTETGQRGMRWLCREECGVAFMGVRAWTLGGRNNEQCSESMGKAMSHNSGRNHGMSQRVSEICFLLNSTGIKTREMEMCSSSPFAGLDPPAKLVPILTFQIVVWALPAISKINTMALQYMNVVMYDTVLYYGSLPQQKHLLLLYCVQYILHPPIEQILFL